MTAVIVPIEGTGLVTFGLLYEEREKLRLVTC